MAESGSLDTLSAQERSRRMQKVRPKDNSPTNDTRNGVPVIRPSESTASSAH